MRVEPILKILVPSMLLKMFPYIALKIYFPRDEGASRGPNEEGQAERIPSIKS
jgi:hypothetical protein